MGAERVMPAPRLPSVKHGSPSAETSDLGPGNGAPSTANDAEKTIVIRDRRKPNQYTTDNLIAREWLPILRVGDAFFFYSIYLSMANRETESSWSSLRTQAEYLQCGVDLIIRGNKLLEICELLYIETGDQSTCNEYYILDPPALTPELKANIYQRLDAIEEQETSKNWQAWVNQVRKALDQHRSLPEIWAERRARKGGRPVKAVRAENSAREPQPGFLPSNAEAQPVVEKGACVPQAGWLCPTNSVVVNHKQGACEPQPEQEQLTSTNEQEKEKKETSLDPVWMQCCDLGVAPTVADILLENYGAEAVQQQIEWLPFRSPRDPPAMLISAVQGNWAAPSGYVPAKEPGNGHIVRSTSQAHEPPAGPEPTQPEKAREGGDAREIWSLVLAELRMQMTRATFDTWLGGSKVIGIDDHSITVQVRDEYAAEWLRRRWITPIQRTVSGIAGQPLEVLFQGQNGPQDLSSQARPGPAP